MSDVVRVMIVDDQELIRTGFRLVLSAEADLEVVAEAGNGRDALAWFDTHGSTACDVVLMDVRMPVMNGLDAAKQMTRLYPEVRVIMLTTFDLDEYAMQAIEAGAGGFLLKDARPTELVDAIHRVHQGDAVMAPSMTRKLIERVRNGAPEKPREMIESFEHLTAREREVLACVAEGLNNAEIAERMFLTESTVKTHVGNIFAKLQVRDRVHAVLLAKQHGM